MPDLRFRVSPAVLGPLGLEQLQDPALALLELIKNSWDADASHVWIRIEKSPSPQIEVEDDGDGMALDDFRSRWLVIGASHKRFTASTTRGRPLIGEKGLGRLATFALGQEIAVESRARKGSAFRAEVNWGRLRTASSIEDYVVHTSELPKPKAGTLVRIGSLSGEWSDQHTDYLVRHVEFLTALPGEKFHVHITVNGHRVLLQSPIKVVESLAEGVLRLKIDPSGTPEIFEARFENRDFSNVTYRDFPEKSKDPRLAGTEIGLRFFRRDVATQSLRSTLKGNQIRELLERFQGIRIYRDGINVPPYGLGGDDWAALEKQRTSTGGPTMVPGNSQLIGEVLLSRKGHPHLVVTAGRAGFADQKALAALQSYVRWAAREMGTMRRASLHGLTTGAVPVRARETAESHKESVVRDLQAAAKVLEKATAPGSKQEAQRVVELANSLASAVDRDEKTLRLYVQLASTGIAATSFAHELRAEFDVITDALHELTESRDKRRIDQELLDNLNGAWGRIQSFAGLFQVVPTKRRRKVTQLSPADIERSARTILGLAPPERIKTSVKPPGSAIRLVPAELDSILLNLVTNAIKAIDASPRREHGQIEVECDVSQGELTLRVRDNGCGVDPDAERSIFEPLEGRFADGTGMGLPITAYIAGRYKGTVGYVRPRTTPWISEFVVKLSTIEARP